MSSEKPFSLSVKAVIRNQRGRCLVLRRSMNSGANKGKWEFPGGKLDPGESFDQALIREALEETGLTISLRRLAGSAESSLENRTVIYLLMEARAESGRVRLSPEHDDFKWVSVEDLPKQDLAPQFRAFAEDYAEAN